MAELTDSQPYAGALEAVDRILNRESEPDEVLLQVVGTLHAKLPYYRRVSLYFVEEDELLLGPSAGENPAERSRPSVGEDSIKAAVSHRSVQIENDVARIDAPVIFEGQVVAVIDVESNEPNVFGEADQAFLERVARLVSAHCLVGWDTGGVPWSDVV